MLAVECKGLLIGEGADIATVEGIRLVFDEDGRVSNVNEILSMHLGPVDILVVASLDFADELTSAEVEAAITEFETRIKSSFSDIQRIFIEAQNWRSSQDALKDRVPKNLEDLK